MPLYGAIIELLVLLAAHAVIVPLHGTAPRPLDDVERRVEEEC